VSARAVPAAKASHDLLRANVRVHSATIPRRVRPVFAHGVTLTVRPARDIDRAELARLRHALWPEGSIAEHDGELVSAFEGNFSSLPFTILVAQIGDRVVGFIEVGLRSHADGCDQAHAVGFIEGWYVAASFRNQGIGRALVAAAEDWSRSQGCTEMASDALSDNQTSQRAHEALGFEVVDRCVHYRKGL